MIDGNKLYYVLDCINEKGKYIAIFLPWHLWYGEYNRENKQQLLGKWNTFEISNKSGIKWLNISTFPEYIDRVFSNVNSVRR